MPRRRILLLALLAACGKPPAEARPTGKLVVDPQVRFDGTPVLGSAEAKLVVKNAGKGPLSVTASVDPPFSVTPQQVDLAPRSWKLVTVRFAPVHEGRVERPLHLVHRGGGPSTVLLSGTARCDCDDHDATTEDSCGDRGVCRHDPIACTEIPPPCWELTPGPERGCEVVPLEDGTVCIEAQGLCHGAGTCEQGRCVVAPARELRPAWAVPIEGGPVLAGGGVAFAIGSRGDLVRVDSSGGINHLADPPAGAQLEMLDRGRLLLSTGEALIGFNTSGGESWGDGLPGDATEPVRFVAGKDGWLVVSATRDLDSCASAATSLLLLDPSRGGFRDGGALLSGWVATGIAVATDFQPWVSAETCRADQHAVFQGPAIAYGLNSNPQRVLAAQGGWVFTQELQLPVPTSDTAVRLPASPGFDPAARTLEPLAGGNAGWVFDCTGPACDAPAAARFFQPGGSGGGIVVPLGARPSGLLLREGSLLVASQAEEGAVLTVATSRRVAESCPVPEGIDRLVTLAGGKLIAVAPDPSGGERLVAFDAPGLELADEGWVAQGGNPGHSRRPIDLR